MRLQIENAFKNSNHAKAVQLAREWASLKYNFARKVMAFSSVQERVHLQRSLSDVAIWAELRDARALLHHQLLYKATGDDMDAHLRQALRSGQGEKFALAKEVRQLRDDVLQRDFSGAVNDGTCHLDWRLLLAESKFNRLMMPATVPAIESIQACLSKDDVYIDFVQYTPVSQEASRYGAIVLLPKGAPQWVELGLAADIDLAVNDSRLIASKLAADFVEQQVESLEHAEELLASKMHELFRNLWEPLQRKHLRSRHTVYLSPDGALGQLTFAALIDSDQTFLGERYRFRYVNSGREFLRPELVSKNRHFVAFANPAYKRSQNPLEWRLEGLEHQQANVVPSGEIDVRQLPGFEWDVYGFSKRVVGWGWKARAFVGNDALESELMHLQSPYVLHIGTHGFYHTPAEGESESAEEENSLENIWFNRLSPIHRQRQYANGFMLAHAESTLNGWANDEFVHPSEDGIVTMEEVAKMSLDDTWLVMLAACNSGVSEGLPGDGLQGLRKGFHRAGARNVVSAVWPMVTTLASPIIDDFYLSLSHGRHPADALAITQSRWLKQMREEQSLGFAAFAAGAFVVDTSGSRAE